MKLTKTQQFNKGDAKRKEYYKFSTERSHSLQKETSITTEEIIANINNGRIIMRQGPLQAEKYARWMELVAFEHKKQKVKETTFNVINK